MIKILKQVASIFPLQKLRPHISISIYSPKTQQYAEVGTAKDQNVHQVY